MATETTEQSEPQEPSSWSRRPEDAREGPDEESKPARSGAAKAAHALRAARQEVGEIGAKLGRGVGRASDALTPPAMTDLRGLLGETNLPGVAAGDPLRALADRLDAEGDLWRGLALRALARAAWADRFTQAVSVVAAAGCVALGVVAALGAMFGSAGAGGRALLLLAGAAVLVCAALVVAWTSASVRGAQRAIAREALGRADLTELRLHRVAVVLAARAEAGEHYREALVRLERDVSAPSR
ncbi:MAG: hypothetical protein HY744_33545 [Deltaproteobacteria bacterium]|nr:hypothetical protein [Deltaproteobacteria bacterium]